MRARAALVFATACLPLLMAGPAAAHLGHGSVRVDVGSFAFEPDSALVTAGDRVLWIWSGLDRNHSVTADSGQPEAFDSDPAGQPNHALNSIFGHTFNQTGRFTYHCKVHAFMRGAVTVVPAPAFGGIDTTRPRLSRLRIGPRRVCPRRTPRCGRTRTYLRFVLSERADLVGRIERLRKGRRARVVRYVELFGRQGHNRHRLRTPGLKPGRYRVRLTAYDDADNRSRTLRVRFIVRRP